MNNIYSPYKLVNFPEKLRSLREERITAPIYLRIKPNNFCNQGCRFCTFKHGDPDGQNMHEQVNHRDVIPREKMLEILEDAVAMGVKAITWTGGGEPLIYPHFVECQNRAVALGLDTSIITNAQALDGPRAEACLPMKWLRASVDYWDGESLQKARHVAPKNFHTITENIKAFGWNDRRQGDFEANVICTKENHRRLIDMLVWLKSCGLDNARVSPVWRDDFLSYHAMLFEAVEWQMEEARALEDAGFKIYSSYKLQPEMLTRTCSRCYFSQITPVIGADQCLYRCTDVAYTDHGRLASLKGKRLADVWFSDEVRDKLLSFDPRKSCAGHQCKSETKNRLYTEMVEAGSDNFV